MAKAAKNKKIENIDKKEGAAATDVAPDSVDMKKPKNKLVILLIVIISILLVLIIFFGVLYFTDSSILKGEDSFPNKIIREIKGKSDEIIPISNEKFETVFKDLNWKTRDCTNEINRTELTAKTLIIAIEDEEASAAKYSTFDNIEDTLQFYEDEKERIKDIFNYNFKEVGEEETSGKNWKKYILQNKSDEGVGYGVIMQVDDTVLVITTQKDINKVQNALNEFEYK